MVLDLRDEVFPVFIFRIPQDDECFDDASPVRVGARDDGAFFHGRVLRQRVLHLEGADRVAGTDDDVIGTALIPEIAFLILLRLVPGNVPLAAEGRFRPPRVFILYNIL